VHAIYVCIDHLQQADAPLLQNALASPDLITWLLCTESRSAAGIRASLQTMIHTQAVRAALPPKSPSNAAQGRVLVAPVSRVKSSGVKERQHMPKFQAVRDKKQRKKNIARHLRTEEVETFRGRVSAYCISMELETDKLLPFLEKW
jgi:hypothetical protein